MSDMTPREHRIRQRAYELWEQAGKPAGDHDRFWHEAEQEIDSAEDKGRRVPR